MKTPEAATTTHSTFPPIHRSASPLPTRSKGRSGLLLGALAVAVCLCAHAYADPLPPCTGAPNLALQELQDNCALSTQPGSFVVTSSTSATITYANTTVTNTVNDYSTTLIGLVNGSQVYSMTFLAPFSDPSLTTAIATADGILSGDGASFGGPSLLSSTSVLLGSVVTPPLTYNCISAEATGSTYLTGSTVTTTGPYFGPATISSGDCNTDTFTVLAGQEDININTDHQYTIPVTTVTTNTYLNSQTYQIAGTKSTVPSTTPEPASLELALTGLGAIGWLRRRQSANRVPHS